MRPLRLRLAAFGAYAGEQTLDFEASLAGHRLFLIHGPTGAGKTTVLDGLCYALFGQSSGEERQAQHLRSHFAPPELRTEAELDFAIGAERWRIQRLAEWQRPAKRGDGTKKEAGNVLLWRLRDTTPELVAEGERAVAPAIEGLLGYKAAEFRQVVLLPQGRFRELLTVDRGKRQEILSRLFRTALYRRVTEQLQARAKEAEKTRQAAGIRFDTLLGQAGATDAASARAARDALAAEASAAVLARDAARLAALAARQALEAAKRDAEKLADAAAAEAALATLRAAAPARQARHDRLAAARRADRLRGVHAAAVTSRTEAEKAAAILGRTTTDADHARAALAEAQAALVDAPSRQAAQDTATRQAAEFQALLERAEAAARAALEAEKAGQHARDAGARLAEAELRLAQAAKAAVEAEVLRAATESEAAQLDRHGLALAEAERLARTRAALAKTEADATRLEAAVAAAEAKGHAAKARLDAAEAARRNAEARIARDHAAHLATSLADGMPCPVCGATDHPLPATPLDGPLPELAPLAEAVLAATTALQQARDTFAEARSDLRARRDDISRLAAELVGQETPADIPALTALRDGAARAAKELSKRSKVCDAAREAEQAAIVQRDAARTADDAARRDLATEIGKRDSLRETLPPDLAAPEALRAAATRQASTAKALAETLARDRDALARATAQADSTTQAREAAEREAASRIEAANHAAAALENACRAAAFADAAEATAALLDDVAQQALAAEVTRETEALARAEHRAETAASAATGIIVQDMVALAAADAAAALAETEATERAGVLLGQVEARRKLIADIEDAEAERATAEAAWQLRLELAETAAGRGTRQRLDLEGFVLRSLLDEALAAANRRLRGLLGGRYTVRRVEVPERRNAAIGLDIEVLDAHTGEARPAGTLSGGEGFCAALALALGLSDTVQAHAGARRIDALFVDEGFGTLDPEALETALQVLSELQAGDRLVGIISHVPELRGRIPARLEVTPGPRGSSAAFRFG
jgi:exonuclease SbcC